MNCARRVGNASDGVVAACCLSSSAVGTVFVHTLANVSTTAGKYARVVIKHPEGTKVVAAGYQVSPLAAENA